MLAKAPKMLVTTPVESDPFFVKIAEGITTAVPHEPLVAVYLTEEANTFDLFVHCYVPDDLVGEPQWVTPFDSIIADETPAGDLQVRYLHIHIDQLFGNSYSLWTSHLHYTVTENIGASAIKVLYDVADPKASRGTVTTVSNTRVPM